MTRRTAKLTIELELTEESDEPFTIDLGTAPLEREEPSRVARLPKPTLRKCADVIAMPLRKAVLR